VCGRYKQTMSADALARHFGAVADAAFVEDPSLDRPRFNAAPTQRLPIVRVVDARRALRPARWGLIPPWSKEPSIGAKLLNARSETVVEKPAFRDAVRRRRCLVPMDGFYEWKTEGRDKIPYLFSFNDDRPFALAGLWSTWKGPAGPVETFSILTTQANALVAALHDRMPVMLDEKEYDQWLDPAQETPRLSTLCAPRPWPVLSLRAVSRRLGSVRVDDDTLLRPDVSPLPVDTNHGTKHESDHGTRTDHGDDARAKTSERPKSSKPQQGSLW